jgi:hypothetical protein
VSSVWQRCTSVVAFANLASKGDHTFPEFTEVVLDNGTHLLGSQERFVQTSVRWVLRELSNSIEEMRHWICRSELGSLLPRSVEKRDHVSPTRVGRAPPSDTPLEYYPQSQIITSLWVPPARQKKRVETRDE